MTDTRVDLNNYALRPLLLMAFRVSEYRLVAPDWVENVRVDITATLPLAHRARQFRTCCAICSSNGPGW